MTRHSTHLGGLRVIGLIGLAAPWLLQGCTHDLLQITDPDIIPDVNTPSGALALKNGVILRLEQVTAGLGGNGPTISLFTAGYWPTNGAPGTLSYSATTWTSACLTRPTRSWPGRFALSTGCASKARPPSPRCVRIAPAPPRTSA